MKTSTARVAAALAVPLIALAACSSGSSDGSSRSSSGSTASHAGGDAGSAGGKADFSGSVASPAQPAAGDANAAEAGAEPAAAVEQAAIISTGSVAMTSPDVAKARSDVQHVADTYGGEITDQETATADDGKMGEARLVLRIPVASFSRAMGDLEKVAHLVDSSTTSTDVSTQVIDVDERVKAARASIDRITLLLSRAEKIGDIMAIEAQLSSREADLNSLLRQQAHLADQTALSTISVTIQRPAPAHHARKAAERSGFLAGLGAGWNALLGFTTGVATVVGALLPWTPVALLVGIPVWLVVRRSRPAAPREPEPSQSA